MGILTIKDCGTAHEEQLIDIYNGLIDKEKDSTGKELTSLEKSNIELQVAEAYQSILIICKFSVFKYLISIKLTIVFRLFL